MTWHILGEQLNDYLGGRIDTPTAASVEAHLVACAQCRQRLAQRTPPSVLTSSWHGVERRIDDEPADAAARLLSRLGVSERHQRLLAPTAPLRLAWLGAVALALGVGATLVRDMPGGTSIGVLVYLTVAAIVPLAAVVAALSTASEPASEVAIAAPLTSVHVLGLRASAALVATVAIALTAGVLVPGPWTESAVWLLPSLAMCALTTALSGRFGPVRAGTAVGVVWICGVAVWVAGTQDRLAPFHVGPQVAYLTVALLGVAMVLHRPDLMEPLRATSARRTPRST